MKPLLQVRQLSVETMGPPPRRILDGIDFAIAPGEVVAVIGASGSGKSTLGMALAGYARPGARIVSGHVRFEDREILSLTPAELRHLRGHDIAFVPQSAAASFNPALRIGFQVAEGPVARREVARRDGEAFACRQLAVFGLSDPGIGRRYPHQVSGGQLQRAAAAMAFAGNPKLIVFDESTTSLDVTTQVDVLAVFRERIRASKVAAFYITHDVAVAAELADRAIVIERGRIVDQGFARDVVARRTAPPGLRVSARVRPSTETVLSVDGLTATYGPGGSPALDDIHFEVRRGEVVAVIGESGSGKTTLARVIAGLLRPSSGTVSFGGRVLPPLVRDRTLRARQGIQIAFQSADLALNPSQRIGEIVGRPLTMFRGLKGARRDAETARLLELFELPADVAARFPHQLSGGQKQRINLLRAIAGDPDLVICDEVTSALDTELRSSVLQLLRHVRDERSIAFLFITHDLSCAADFADRLLVLRKGSVVEAGPTTQLLDRPAHPYTAELVRSVPQVDFGWLDRAIAYRRSTKPAVTAL